MNETKSSMPEKQKKKHSKHIFTFVMILCCIISIVIGGIRVISTSSKNKNQSPNTADSTSAIIKHPELKPPPETFEPVSVSLIAVGDNLIHNTLIKDAHVSGNTYNFNPFYDNIRTYIQAADIAVINQESPLGTGEPSGYPSFNTPQACGEALIDAGFDVISHANNHAMDSGSSAIYDTIDFWDRHADDGVIRIGAARNAEDRAKIRYLERNGLKIGFLAYTYGLNGYSLPKDNPDLISLIDKEKISAEMAAVKEKCDALVVIMHWGEEYQTTENQEQNELAEFLTEHGATLIIGSHPHVCQPCEWIESENGNRAFCIYSTGNFISAQNQTATMVESMLQVTLTRQSDGTVVVENPGVMPLVCYFNSRWRGYTVLPLDDYTESMAASHALAGKQNMSPSNLRSIVTEIYGDYLINKIVPTTYCTEKNNNIA